MLTTRWIVELAAPDLMERLPAEQLELATCIDGADGRRLLVYRDNFIAYKVASLTGSRVRQGRLVGRGEQGLPLEDGRRLVLEPCVADPFLMA